MRNFVSSGAIELSKLLDYTQWEKMNPGLSLMAYACHNLTPDLAIAVTKLFFPDFIDYEGSVFPADHFNDKIYLQWIEYFSGNLTEVEKMMNHVHLLDMLPFDSLGKDNICYLGTVLKKSWEQALHEQFPNYHFSFFANWDEGEEDFVLSFFRDRSTEE